MRVVILAMLKAAIKYISQIAKVYPAVFVTAQNQPGYTFSFAKTGPRDASMIIVKPRSATAMLFISTTEILSSFIALYLMEATKTKEFPASDSIAVIKDHAMIRYRPNSLGWTYLKKSSSWIVSLDPCPSIDVTVGGDLLVAATLSGLGGETKLT